MDLVEIGGFWGGASKCKGPEVCLMGRKAAGSWSKLGGWGGTQGQRVGGDLLITLEAL